jgi:hypothetical protein
MTTKVDDDLPYNINLFDLAVKDVLAKIKSFDNEKGIMYIGKILEYFLGYGNRIKEHFKKNKITKDIDPGNFVKNNLVTCSSYLAIIYVAHRFKDETITNNIINNLMGTVKDVPELKSFVDNIIKKFDDTKIIRTPSVLQAISLNRDRYKCKKFKKSKNYTRKRKSEMKHKLYKLRKILRHK